MANLQHHFYKGLSALAIEEIWVKTQLTKAVEPAAGMGAMAGTASAELSGAPKR